MNERLGITEQDIHLLSHAVTDKCWHFFAEHDNHHIKNPTIRVPTHFQKLFSILFQYLFNTKLKKFNTMPYLHFSTS